MKNYIIFFDNDGVTSNWATWGNDTYFNSENRDMSQINIYIWNKIDQICRRLEDDTNVYIVCISSWKEVFEKPENREWLAKYAGFKKIKILYDDELVVAKRFSHREPGERIKTIKNYLDKYKPIDYIILDDEFKIAYKEENFHNIIHTDMYNGIDNITFNKIVDIIHSWNIKPEVKQKIKEKEEIMNILLRCSI